MPCRLRFPEFHLPGSVLLDGSSSSSVLLRLVVLLWLVQPAVAFMPIAWFDIYMETLAVGLPLMVLQSLATASIRRRPPILIRVVKRNTTLPTQSQHLVTTSRDDQTEIVIALWAGAGGLPYRYRRAGDVLLGFVRQRVPAAPQATVQVNVTISLLWEWSGHWDRGGCPPPVERYRLLVATEIADNGNHDQDNDTSRSSTRSPVPPPEMRDLVLAQWVNTLFFKSLVKPESRIIALFPWGRGWDPDDLEAADGPPYGDRFIDPIYPRIPEMFKMLVDNDANDKNNVDSVLLLLELPLPLLADHDHVPSEWQQQPAAAAGSVEDAGSGDGGAAAVWINRRGAFIEPGDDCHYKTVRSMNACFHVSSPPVREHPFVLWKMNQEKRTPKA